MTLQQFNPPCGTGEALPDARDRFPVAGLLALASAGFLTILTETLPAGLLPQIAEGLAISEAMAGQMVSIYALGSLLAAIPLTAVTRRVRRRRLLVAAILGFAVLNATTALSTSVVLTMAARFLAGVAAGLVWALLAGHASRMVAPAQQGRAIALAMVGTPLALSIGLPAGALMGEAIGWRASFAAMSALSVGLIAWLLISAPEFPGRAGPAAAGFRRVLRRPAVTAVLAVTFGFVLAHNILYTYIAPFVSRAGIGSQTSGVLALFGLTALGGVAVTGALIDRRLRSLVLVSIVGFLLSAATLTLRGETPAVVWAAVAVWGGVFGGAASLFQTAAARAAGSDADLAQSLIVTVWNLAIAGGGLIGGVLIARDPGALPPALILLLLPTLVIALRAREAFPRHPS